MEEYYDFTLIMCQWVLSGCLPRANMALRYEILVITKRIQRQDPGEWVRGTQSQQYKAPEHWEENWWFLVIVLRDLSHEE